MKDIWTIVKITEKNTEIFFPSENKSKSVSLSSSGKLISRQMQNSSIRLDSHVALLYI